MHKFKLLLAVVLLNQSTVIAQNFECVILQDSMNDTTNGLYDILPPYICGSPSDYSTDPDYLEQTPIKTIRLVLHILQDVNGNGNFDDIDINDQSHNSQSEFIGKLFNSLNSRYADFKEETRQYPNNPVPAMGDSRIRFELLQQNIYNHKYEDFDDYDDGTNNGGSPDSRLGIAYNK
ncbi:MAG: hypothetical protein KDC92_06695 [Bacteroidetes bacterium]|nr:hypothetical protein [Bacteroidota bacterium]